MNKLFPVNWTVQSDRILKYSRKKMEGNSVFCAMNDESRTIWTAISDWISCNQKDVSGQRTASIELISRNKGCKKTMKDHVYMMVSKTWKSRSKSVPQAQELEDMTFWKKINFNIVTWRTVPFPWIFSPYYATEGRYRQGWINRLGIICTLYGYQPLACTPYGYHMYSTWISHALQYTYFKSSFYR